MAVIGWLDRLNSGVSVVLEFDLPLPPLGACIIEIPFVLVYVFSLTAGPATLSGLTYLLHGQFLGIMSSVPNQGPLCLLSFPTHIYALSRRF